MKLHLGCGEKHIDGFINIDSRNLKGVDLVDDISKLESIESGSVDLIYACHVLEHFGRHKYMDVIKRWYVLLKPGGVIRISIPDFEAVCEHYNENKDVSVLRGFLYGGQNYAENYHYCTWDFKSIVKDLNSVGFKNVEKYDWRKTEHYHIDDYSQCYLPHMDKENGKLMSLNIEATK